MAKTNNPYGNLNLDREKIEEAIQSVGGTDYKEVPKGGSQVHLHFEFQGKPYVMDAYFNKDGTTTLSCQNGKDKAIFEQVAKAICEACSLGNGGRFEVSIPRFSSENLSNLIEFLQSEGATVLADEADPQYRLLRIQSKQGDTLTIKHFTNGTLQLQGKRAMLAVHVLDFFSVVLNDERAIKAQLDTFEVDLEIKDVQTELEGKWNSAFKRVPDVVRDQLTTALALTKIDIELPDYCAVAFPAVRGLEGFLKSELGKVGFKVPKTDSFREYFERDNPTDPFKMTAIHAGQAGAVATKLADCYTQYHAQRHTIAHMGTTGIETRVMKTLADAQQVVFKVFDIINEF